MEEAARRRVNGSTIAAGVFTAAYLGAATYGAVATGNGEFVFYIVVMLCLVAFVVGVHLRFGFSNGLLWSLSIWGLLHMAGGLLPVPASWPINGDVRVLYSWWLIPNALKYDHVVHAFGFGTTTWACWQVLRSILRSRSQPGAQVHPTMGMLVLCAAAGLGFGALNEVVEFAATLLVPETNVGGYINTGWDLVANSVGASCAALLIRIAGQ